MRENPNDNGDREKKKSIVVMVSQTEISGRESFVCDFLVTFKVFLLK